MGLNPDPTAAQTDPPGPVATDFAESPTAVSSRGFRGSRPTAPPFFVTSSLELEVSPVGEDAWLASQVEQEGSAGWKKGLLWGGLVGAGAGILAYLLVDAIPCDSCSGTGADSSADGAFLEFAVGFGVLGAAIGALVGAL